MWPVTILCSHLHTHCSCTHAHKSCPQQHTDQWLTYLHAAPCITHADELGTKTIAPGRLSWARRLYYLRHAATLEYASISARCKLIEQLLDLPGTHLKCPEVGSNLWQIVHTAKQLSTICTPEQLRELLPAGACVKVSKWLAALPAGDWKYERQTLCDVWAGLVTDFGLHGQLLGSPVATVPSPAPAPAPVTPAHTTAARLPKLSGVSAPTPGEASVIVNTGFGAAPAATQSGHSSTESTGAGTPAHSNRRAAEVRRLLDFTHESGSSSNASQHVSVPVPAAGIALAGPVAVTAEPSIRTAAAAVRGSAPRAASGLDDVGAAAPHAHRRPPQQSLPSAAAGRGVHVFITTPHKPPPLPQQHQQQHQHQQHRQQGQMVESGSEDSSEEEVCHSEPCPGQH